MAKGVDALFSFDTTGSVYPCLTQVRRHVEETVRRLFRDIPNLRIAITAHGDYCDAGITYVTKSLDFSTDLETICRFIRNVGATYGGDAPECYELVLHEARSLSWKAGNEKVFVMIGDDVPHEKSYPGNVKRVDWRNELELLLEAGIHVYGVHAMPGIRRHSKGFYEEIARKTGGYYLTLDQFAAITDIIYAICYKQVGEVDLQSFQEEVQRGNRMSRNMASVFETLTGRHVKVAAASGLIPVPAGRFQVMGIDANQAIREFVEEQGLTFKTGRGFYQFTKPETIQERKEVVLMDKTTGDMYSGAQAREIIGLPLGMRGKIKPTSLEKYHVFVQSTSYNRKLIGGTLFLYEVEDV
ncbi:MAG: hypothetical protein HGA31_02180 [Candidatus Moranbacteria bacterium]|nr:hypothetical protein [Candidatus Moranbacteria bacterium]